MPAKHIYDTTVSGVMEWAKGELEHVGRIVSIKDTGIQYNYALSTIYGMAHLRDALYQMVSDPEYKEKKVDLLKTHNAVVRVMKHLIKDYKIDLSAVQDFNKGHVLRNMSYLKKGSKTRKNRK
jgi:hypothetical protein